MKQLTIVILAAGEAKRFGSAKQLALINDKPMLQTVIDQCRGIPHVSVSVVLGARYQTIQSQLHLQDVQILINPDWKSGISTSIKLATALLGDNNDGLLFVTGDQPLITQTHLSDMITQWRSDSDVCHAASYGDTAGIPAIFPRNAYQKLMALTGDEGAKKLLLEKDKSAVRLIAMPEAEMDIDRVEDLLKRNVQQ